jgi:hypothetical protein
MLLKNISSVIARENIYWCLCVPLFCFSVIGSSGMQFGVIYPEILGITQPCVAFLTLEFCFGSLFLVEHALHRTHVA